MQNGQTWRKADRRIQKKLPQIVIIVDELADLMMVAPGEVEECYLSSGTVGQSSGTSSDPCNTETICKCYYRIDQSKHAFPNCFFCIIRCRFKNHYRYEWCGKAARKGRHALLSIRISETCQGAGIFRIGSKKCRKLLII